MQPDVMPESPEPNDDQTLMKGVAQECLRAIETGDHEQFMNAMRVMIHDAMSNMSENPGE